MHHSDHDHHEPRKTGHDWPITIITLIFGAYLGLALAGLGRGIGGIAKLIAGLFQ